MEVAGLAKRGSFDCERHDEALRFSAQDDNVVGDRVLLRLGAILGGPAIRRHGSCGATGRQGAAGDLWAAWDQIGDGAGFRAHISEARCGAPGVLAGGRYRGCDAPGLLLAGSYVYGNEQGFAGGFREEATCAGLRLWKKKPVALLRCFADRRGRLLWFAVCADACGGGTGGLEDGAALCHRLESLSARRSDPGRGSAFEQHGQPLP